jgi:hypothetical protein
MSANLAWNCCCTRRPFDPGWGVHLGYFVAAPNTHAGPGGGTVHENENFLLHIDQSGRTAECDCVQGGWVQESIDLDARTAMGIAAILPWDITFYPEDWDCRSEGFNPYTWPGVPTPETWGCEYYEPNGAYGLAWEPTPSGCAFAVGVNVPWQEVGGVWYPTHLVTLEVNFSWSAAIGPCEQPNPAGYNRTDPARCFHPFIPPDEQDIGYPDRPYAGVLITSDRAYDIPSEGPPYDPNNPNPYVKKDLSQYCFLNPDYNWAGSEQGPLTGGGSITLDDRNDLPDGTFKPNLSVSASLYNILGEFVRMRFESSITVNASWNVYASVYNPPS